MVFLYWLIWEPIIFPVWCVLLKVLSRDDWFLMLETERQLGKWYFLVLIIISILNGKKIKIPSFVLITVIILILYLVIHDLNTGTEDLGMLRGNILEVVTPLFPFLLLNINRDVIPQCKKLYLVILILIVLEFAFSILNLNGIYAYLTFYIPYHTVSETGALITGFDDSLVSGTFGRYNVLANFLTTVYLYYSILYFFDAEFSKRKYYLFSFLILYVIFLTGARISVLMFIYSYGICCFLTWRKHKKELLYSLIVALFLMTSFFVLSEFVLNNTESEGIKRNVEGFVHLFESANGETDSTFDLSIYLIDNYFYRSPIIGNGLAWKGAFAYGNFGVCTLANFAADAHVAYLLVEFGVIGFLFYMVYYYSYLKTLKYKKPIVSKKKLNIIFLYYFLLTVTENGFFDRMFFIYAFIFSFCFLETTNNYQKFGHQED